MPLKIALKPQERLVVGGAVLMNGGVRCEFTVENSVPVLREKDIMTREAANTPCRRIYFIIQLMYLDERNLVEHHSIYWSLVKDLVVAAPRTVPVVDQVSEHILNGDYYHALKLARRLIDFEEEVVAHVRSADGSLSENSESDHVWTGDRSPGAYQGRAQA